MTDYVAVIGASSPASSATSVVNGVKAQVATLAYTDTVAKTMFTIPDGAVILQWIINVTTAFNSDGTDLIQIGVSGTASKYALNVVVSATGLITAGVVLTQVGVAQSGAQIVTSIYANGGSAASTGALTLMVLYQTP